LGHVLYDDEGWQN